MVGFIVTPYVFDDLLVDTGFSHAASVMREYLQDQPISAICCTHHHEDHTGNAGVIAADKQCPIYLNQPRLRQSEGVARLLPYRWTFWGPVDPYTPEPMPSTISTSGGRTLEVIPTPGHSRTHVVFFEPQTGLVFSGDLFLSTGASAVMTYENPYHLAQSLRRVAALSPSRLLSGHGLMLDNPEQALRTKARRIEEAALRAVSLFNKGIETKVVARRIFDRGHRRDCWMKHLTTGEYSRHNFVRASITYAKNV
jgi:glyoxylase-like metal-dependent hydrolase (beta-lactamase superfamily II)